MSQENESPATSPITFRPGTESFIIQFIYDKLFGTFENYVLTGPPFFI